MNQQQIEMQQRRAAKAVEHQRIVDGIGDGAVAVTYWMAPDGRRLMVHNPRVHDDFEQYIREQEARYRRSVDRR